MGVGSPHSLCLHTWPNEESEQTGFHTGLTWAHSVPGAQLSPASKGAPLQFELMQTRMPALGSPGGNPAALGWSQDNCGQGNLTVKTVSLPMLTISTTGSG